MHAIHCQFAMAMGYTDHIAGRVSALLAICTRHLSRATRRLLRLHHRRCYGGAAAAAARSRREQPVAVDDGGKALWRRTILMGERCQPLDFAGAIHYDSSGRLLARPRSPPSLSLSRRSSGSLSASASEASCYLYTKEEIST